MHILLINTNPVVSRLISFCMRKEHMILEEVQDAGDLARERYDVVFVDEASCSEETKKILAHLPIRKKVFLSSREEAGNEAGLFDAVIKKPFLPSQITALLENLEEDDALEASAQVPSIFPLSSDEANVENVQEGEDKTPEEPKVDTAVLDRNEIEKIKALLDMEEEEAQAVSDEEYESRKAEVIKQQLIADGLEIVEVDEYIEALSRKPLAREPLVKKKKKNRSKKSKKTEEETFTFEEALLAAVAGMKVKKIKKLLKGAEVTIKINFKDRK